VDCYLNNHGNASLEGDYSLQIELPQGYTTDGGMIQSASAASHIQWQITAPANPKTAANINIRIPVDGRPTDQNTNTAAYFPPANMSKQILITTIEKSVIVDILLNRTPNKVAKGDKGVSMLGLVFDNHEAQSNPVILNSIYIKVTDRKGVAIADPRTVITRVAIVNYNRPTVVLGQVSDIPNQPEIGIIFTEPDTIGAAHSDSLDICVDISQQASVTDVMVTIESSSKIDMVEMYTTKRPVIKTPEGNTGTTLGLKSDYVVLMADNLKQSFGNYPNPFGSEERTTTTITYYLKEDANIQISIFTLLGEPVWTRTYKSTDDQGRMGSHDGDVRWDAYNDKGHIVLNGVYVAYIKTAYGETAVTKIAVVK
jgi:hypothetical protein